MRHSVEHSVFGDGFHSPWPGGSTTPPSLSPAISLTAFCSAALARGMPASSPMLRGAEMARMSAVSSLESPALEQRGGKERLPRLRAAHKQSVQVAEAAELLVSAVPPVRIAAA